MGIRVHKTIGWGVNDLQTVEIDKGSYVETRLQDLRFDPTKFCKEDNYWNLTREKFLTWVEENAGRLDGFIEREGGPRRLEFDRAERWVKFERGRVKHRGDKVWYPFRSFIWGDDGLSPNVLQVIPPECPDWFRYDDIIDWVEETGNHQQLNRTEMLRGCGIYPYSSGWIRFRDPSEGVWNPPGPADPECQWDEKGPVRMSPSRYSMLTGDWDSERRPLASDEQLAHLRADWRPPVPNGVLAILLFHEVCFADLESFINDLRPMLYVYWS